jgi:uncharacterized protein (TIGR03086 family)
MASFDLLDRAADEFRSRLRLVTDAQRSLPTPCGAFNVRDLVDHQIRGMRSYTMFMNGATVAEATEEFRVGDIAPEDWVEVFNGDYRTMREAFGAPGALERTVSHWIGDMPATELFVMRIVELAVHGWDLARAIGTGEALDADVVAVLWAHYEPISDRLRSSGLFGSGASGTCPDSAPLQARLLDLLGRRP